MAQTSSWRRVHLRDVADVRTGLAKNSKLRGVLETRPYLRVANVQDGHVDLTAVKRISVPRSDVGRFELRIGDVLMTEGGDFDKLGRGTVWRGEIPGCLHQNHVFAVRPDQSQILPEFLAAWTTSSIGRRYFAKCAKQTTNLASVNAAQVRAASIELPPLEVQRAVARVVSALLKKRAGYLALASKKRELKRAVQKRLLDPTLEHGPPSLNVRPLADFLKESRVLASSGAHARKLTIRLYGRGVIAKADTRPGSSSTQYYRRTAGQFIYSKLDFLNGAFGIVPAALDGFESTLDLPAFDIADGVNARWLVQLFTYPGFYRRQVRLANGGRKARRVNPSELLKLMIRIPPVAEQEAIASCLDAVDREIQLLEQLARACERQKLAVLDRLLAGKHPIPAT